MKQYQIGEIVKYRNESDCEFWGYAEEDSISAYIYILGGGGAWYVSTTSLQRKKKDTQ
jgi:hypothetical protein